MSTLAQALEQYGSQAYLLTVAADGPHASHVRVTLQGNECHFAVGKSARRNARENPHVSLLWSPPEPGGYSIIVNGLLRLADADEEQGIVTVTKSVLHRPGEPQTPGGACTSDCQPLTVSSGST